MKQFILLVTISLFLYSCNDERFIISSNEEEKEAIELNSYEDFFSMFPKVKETPIEESRGITLRSGLQNYRATGYTDYSKKGPMKVGLFKENAAVFGIEGGIYIAEFYTVVKEIDIPAGGVFVAIPKGCNGWRPNYKSPTDYGYSIEYNDAGTKAILTTRITRIVSNMLGQTLNIWKPASLSSLYWDYGIYSN